MIEIMTRMMMITTTMTTAVATSRVTMMIEVTNIFILYLTFGGCNIHHQNW